jgi:hypothetical protein
MRILVFLLFTFFVCNTVFAQNEILKKNKWSDWKIDTTKMDDGSFNVIQKRIKYSCSNCLVTEEIIFFHDACGGLIRKIKLKSDCKRNIGEGSIIRERKYRSKCARGLISREFCRKKCFA